MSEAKTPIQEIPSTNGTEVAGSGSARWQVAGRALRHRNFQFFFSGQLISLIGTWMQSVAQSWLVYRLTGSALLLGSVGFASQIPVFLFAPLGGIAADRYNRRQIVIGTQIASMLLAFILAVLTLSHWIDNRIWMIFVLADALEEPVSRYRDVPLAVNRQCDFSPTLYLHFGSCKLPQICHF